MLHGESEALRSNLLQLEAAVFQDVPASHVEVRLQVTSSSALRSSEASRAIAEIAELLARIIHEDLHQGFGTGEGSCSFAMT